MRWWVIPLVVAAAALLMSPSLLPRLGRLVGRRARETGAAGAEATRAFKEELDRPDDPEQDAPGG